VSGGSNDISKGATLKSHPLMAWIFSSAVTLATVLDEGPVDVATIGVSSHSPDIIGGDNC